MLDLLSHAATTATISLALRDCPYPNLPPSKAAMDSDTKAYRKRVVDMVRLISSPADQTDYQRDIPIADVPGELVSGFVDDLYHPKSRLFLDAFSENELRSLAELYGMICISAKAFSRLGCHSVADIQKVPEWRSVMAFAQTLVTELN